MAVDSVLQEYRNLSAEEQEQVRAAVIPAPSQRFANGLWVLTFVILGGVIFVGGGFAIEASGSDETALYGFVGIALGAVAGVLAPSPLTQ